MCWSVIFLSWTPGTLQYHSQCRFSSQTGHRQSPAATTLSLFYCCLCFILFLLNINGCAAGRCCLAWPSVNRLEKQTNWTHANNSAVRETCVSEWVSAWVYVCLSVCVWVSVWVYVCVSICVWVSGCMCVCGQPTSIKKTSTDQLQTCPGMTCQ